MLLRVDESSLSGWNGEEIERRARLACEILRAGGKSLREVKVSWIVDTTAWSRKTTQQERLLEVIRKALGVEEVSRRSFGMCGQLMASA